MRRIFPLTSVVAEVHVVEGAVRAFLEVHDRAGRPVGRAFAGSKFWSPVRAPEPLMVRRLIQCCA
jgi:hypothetical protein